MKNKKYEGSTDSSTKMPFTSKTLDHTDWISEHKKPNRTLEVGDRIIEIHDK